ncbi:autotransporter-associated beta strand repeat-containing protein [Phyllobacterium sp. YR531]|uniref:beta strand repeat-containing protein n=1 Tax=Phyllobacterium sp. YR531 TaxID=1144343 RepID=UPI0012F6E0AC|nr:autotransporter-associated beta strand repeat-containing protein [Phyllobacterium sp. YR531]
MSAGLTIAPHLARADDAYWDANNPANNGQVGGGAGTWNGSNNNWTTSDGNTNSSWSGGDTAIFKGVGGDVSVSGQRDVGGLTFETGGYTLGGFGSINLTDDVNKITAADGTTTKIDVEVEGNEDSQLVKEGEGTVILSERNSYEGGTRVNGGTLQIEASQGPFDSGGTLGSTSGSTYVGGGVLDLGNTAQTQKNLTAQGGSVRNGRFNVETATLNGGIIETNTRINASQSIGQSRGDMKGTANTPLYNLYGGTMSGFIVNADNVNQSGGVLSGTATTENYDLSGGTLAGTGTVNTDNATIRDDGAVEGQLNARVVNQSGGTISGNIGTITDKAEVVNHSGGDLSGTANTERYNLSENGTVKGSGVVNADTVLISGGTVEKNGRLNAEDGIGQTGGVMGGNAVTPVYNMSGGEMSGNISGGIAPGGEVINADRVNQWGGKLSGTAATDQYNLFGNGTLTSTGIINAKNISMGQSAIVERNAHLNASNGVAQSGGNMGGIVNTPLYNLTGGNMSGSIVNGKNVYQSNGTLSGTANTEEYALSGRGELTGTVTADKTTIRDNASVSSSGRLNSKEVSQSGGNMGGIADTATYDLSGGIMSGEIKNGVNVNHSNGTLSGVATTTNYDLSGTGILSGKVTAGKVTISDAGSVTKDGRLNVSTSISQSGGDMGGNASTTLYDLSNGTISGGVNAVNIEQSGGKISGRATAAQNYDLSGNGRVTSTGIVSAGKMTLNDNVTVEKGGQLYSRTSIAQSGGTLSGTANTLSYELSKTGKVDGTVNSNTLSISDDAEVTGTGQLNVSQSISQSGGSMGGNAKTAQYSQSGGSMGGKVETNNYILSNGNASGTITAYRGFALQGGSLTGTATTNVFSQSGGTMRGTVTTNSYLLSGGTLENSNRVTTNAFGQTGGEVRGDVVAGIKAKAMGGTIAALSNSGIDVSNTDNDVTISTDSKSPVVNRAGNAILARNVNGNINIQTAGGVSGATGINAYATGKGDVNIVSNNIVQGTAGAAVSAGSTGGRVTIAGSGAIAGGSHGVFVKSQNGDIDVKTGNTISGKTAISLETSGNGAMNLNLGGAVTASDTAISFKGEATDSHAILDHDVRAGNTALRSENKGLTTFDNFATIRSTSANPETLTLLDNVAGKAILNNHSGGQMQGVLSSGAGAETIVNNMAGGVWNVGNSGVFTLLGDNDVIQNSGLIKVSGNTRFDGLETFENRAGGDLNLINNKVTDRLTISGDYVGKEGSNISLDVDFDKGTSDVVTLGGVLVGKTNIKINALTAGQDPSAFGKTILLVDVPDDSGGGELTASGLPTGGVIEYNLIRQDLSGGGSKYVVRSGVDGTAASSVVSGFIAAQNVIGSSFFKPSSGLVSAPVDPDKNQFGFAPWMRTNGGLSEIDTSGTITQPDGSKVDTPATIETSYYGYQVGLDGGIFNIQDTDANVNFGVTAGQIFGKSDQKNYSNTTDFTSVFYGGYAAYTKGPFFFDVQVRNELMDYTINVNDPLFKIGGADVNGDRVSISGSTSYTFKHNDWSFIPATGFTYSKSSTDDLIIPRNIVLNQNAARVRFADVESMIGFGGITVSRNFFFKDDSIRVSPFVTLTGYHDFAGDINATLTVDPGSAREIVFPVKTERLQTYGEASFGVNVLALTGKINGVERLVIGSVRGDVQYGEDIFGGSMTAQFRMQF